MVLGCFAVFQSAQFPGSFLPNSRGALAFQVERSWASTRLLSSSTLYAQRGIPPPPPPPPAPPTTGGIEGLDFNNVLSNLFLHSAVSSTGDSSSSDESNVVTEILGSLQKSLSSFSNFDGVDFLQRFSPEFSGSSNMETTTFDESAVAEILGSLQQSLTSLSSFDVVDFVQRFLLFLDQLPIKPYVMAFVKMVQDEINAFDGEIVAQLDGLTRQLQNELADKYPSALGPISEKMIEILKPLAPSPTVFVLLSFVVTFLATNAFLTWSQPPPPSQPYPLNKYDPIGARAYFDRRLVLVISRGLEIAFKSLGFGVNLLMDKLTNKIAENEVQRGRELAVLLTKLGPTFIKVGQSLSIRTDLLSPAYQRGLETLQDQVPAFDTITAREILEDEWGRPVNSVIEELSREPIAAASLGQVYKAKLKRSGREVAIKVQRPDINEQIALDMHLLREMGYVVKNTLNLNTDTVGTVDAWGKGFVDELDYIQEAQSAMFFSEKIMKTPLKDVVLAPAVVNELTTTRVLVTDWVEGQRLDKSDAKDVTILCSIAMNTYLTMLLELGLLHCDPHPGNLLRTLDGRLCILDWGMVTQLDENLQLTLIEHMAHLTSGDYAEIPSDLLLLGFIPEKKKGSIKDSGVVELLAEIYGTWSRGGGAAAFNVNEVISKLQDLTAEKGSLFQIPPYFAYIAKTFSVLEGIGLSNNPKYSIINECLPYVSKRLLTDNERCGTALSTFIFGPDKNKPDRFVDYKRVEQLVRGFGEYTTSASGALLGKQNANRIEVLDAAADKILDLVFTEEITPLQEIVLDQTAKIVASSSRQLLSQLRERSGVLPSGRTLLGFLVDPLGLWRTSPLVRPNDQDERTVETTLKLIELVRNQAQASKIPALDFSNITREEALALSSILARKFWQRRYGVLQTGNRFMRRSLELMAEQLEKGERDSRVLPYREPEVVSEKNLLEPQFAVTNAVDSTSKRLQEARRLLDGYANEEFINAVDPVSFRKSRLD